MEREEAKAILELCRPGNQDDRNDPMIAEALDLVESDSDLKAAFEEQQALDCRISDSLCELEPPADLKTSILAGMRAHSMKTSEEEATKADDPVPFETASKSHSPHSQQSHTWWRNQWMGIAAALAILFVLVMIPRETPTEQLASVGASADTEHSVKADVPSMIQFLAAEIEAVSSNQRSFAKQSNHPAALQAFLASAGAPSPRALPSAVDSHPSIGCFTFDYNGIEMGMICFKEERVLHLTTIRKTDCLGELPEQPALYEIGNQAFKVWVEGDQVQILAVEGSKETLADFI